jgi:hypothetical protein
MEKERGACHLQKAPGLPGSAPTVSNGFATTAVDSACRMLRLLTIRARFVEIGAAAEPEELC